jgi:hypothetical protein
MEIASNDDERVVTVLLNAGDMLLWDSRVARCSYPPAPTTAATTVPGSGFKNTVYGDKNLSVAFNACKNSSSINEWDCCELQHQYP